VTIKIAPQRIVILNKIVTTVCYEVRIGKIEVTSHNKVDKSYWMQLVWAVLNWPSYGHLMALKFVL